MLRKSIRIAAVPLGFSMPPRRVVTNPGGAEMEHSADDEAAQARKTAIS